MPRVVHFEFPADDPERASRFYGDVFGWKFQKWDGPMEYWLISTGDGEPGIDGGMMRRQDPQSAICNTVGVRSLDETVAKIEARGGRTVAPRMPIQGIGWVAYCQDPEGNVFGVLEPDEGAR
jgi:uncharacterized protein